MAATPLVTPHPPAGSVVHVSGVPVVVFFGQIQSGFITNPVSATDQGIDVAEILYVDCVNPAVLAVTSTTIALQPGQTFIVPTGCVNDVTVNAATSGHRFSAVLTQPGSPITPAPLPPGFPPDAPSSLQKTIRAYLYQEYSDDDDLQAFFATYNANVQNYVDWFNTADLPIYTSTQVSGALLDWVAQGLYGFTRPYLFSGGNRSLGPFNTYQLNTVPFNTIKRVGPQNVAATNDDIFKRIITWNFYKGDGTNFNIRWLKRRVWRFLNGANGTDFNIDETYRVSVTFGLDNQINITIINGIRTIIGGALFNRFSLNGAPFNSLKTTFTSLPQVPNATYLQEAIDAGVLQLPFQFTYVVTV